MMGDFLSLGAHTGRSTVGRNFLDTLLVFNLTESGNLEFLQLTAGIPEGRCVETPPRHSL